MVGHVHSIPGSVLAWVPYLWQTVLFPGQSAHREASTRFAIFWLLLLPAVLLYGSLSFHLFEPDEGRYAEIPREMLARGEWIVPYLQSEPYLDKPPLLYWLVMLSYGVFGIHDWAARLVPALAVHGTIVLTYLLGRRSLGDRPAFWGALLLALAPGFIGMGRLLTLDSLLTFFVFTSVLAAFEAIRFRELRWRWWLLAAAACGLGILAKGPVALVLLVPPIWAYRSLSSQRCLIPGKAHWLFAMVVLSIALPWYLAICLRLPQFCRYFLWEHNVVRFLAPFDHLEPVWYYVPIFLVGLLPATLWGVRFFQFLLSGNEAVRRLRIPEFGFMLLAGGWCLFFFSCSGCKLPTYIMPAFPPLALAVGYFLASSGRLTNLSTKVAFAASFFIIAVGNNLALPWYAGYRAPRAHLAQVREVCQDLKDPVLCYPRNCDSMSFYIGRDDLLCFRSKQTHLLIYFMQQRPKTVLLLTHRHSLESLRHALTPDLRVTKVVHFGLDKLPGLSEAFSMRLVNLMGETSLGLCDLAVVERLPDAISVVSASAPVGF
jgi:4-amino-4-deoxy-L-arabinose transferase-like glycosyltransferase